VRPLTSKLESERCLAASLLIQKLPWNDTLFWGINKKSHSFCSFIEKTGFVNEYVLPFSYDVYFFNQ